MSGRRLIVTFSVLLILAIALIQPWVTPPDAVAPIDLPASPTAQLADAIRESAGESAPTQASSVETATTQALPELLQLPPEPSGPVAHWAELPIAPNLPRWRALAERDPELARQLADSLRRCAGYPADTRERALQEWAEQERETRARERDPAEAEQSLERQWAPRYRYRLQAIEHCAGVADPIGEYLKWLEQAGRGLPDSELRQRLRLEFVERAFDDMRSAAERIGRIDEVIRRRDLSRAWLEQLRDAGMLRAIDAYAAAMRGWQGLYSTDTVEYLAWYYVRQMNDAAQLAERAARMNWPNQQRGLSASQQWSEGIQASPMTDASPEQRLEATRRGRDYYVRVFGAPPP
jgi:hypothetical protein